MSLFFGIIAIIVFLWITCAIWNHRPRRPHEDGFQYVYINQDGSARELADDERDYLNTEFHGADGARPYVKSRYESKDGWGSISGFIERRKVPARIQIVKIAPDPSLNHSLATDDIIADAEAVGDLVERRSDGSISITPNPSLGTKERFKLMTQRQLWLQKNRENEWMKHAIGSSDKPSDASNQFR